MSPSTSRTIALVLCGALVSAARATVIVVPQAKPPTTVARDEPRRDPSDARTAPAPRPRPQTDAEAKCSEALAALSLGVDDDTARERLKSRDCQ